MSDNGLIWRVAPKIRAFFLQMSEMAKIELKFYHVWEENKKMLIFRFARQNFWGLDAVFFPTFQDSCFFPGGGGIWPEY